MDSNTDEVCFASVAERLRGLLGFRFFCLLGLCYTFLVNVDPPFLDRMTAWNHEEADAFQRRQVRALFRDADIASATTALSLGGTPEQMLVMYDTAYLAARIANGHTGCPEFRSSTSYHFDRIWDLVLQKLRNSTSQDRYRLFFDRIGGDKLVGQMVTRVSQQAVVRLLASNSIRDQRVLTSLPNAESFDVPGWYLGVCTDLHDPTWMRLYVGQGKIISERINKHRERTRSLAQNAQTGQLWYAFARPNGRVTRYFGLGDFDRGILDTDDDFATFLNVGEQFWAVALQPLQSGDMDKWLVQGLEKASTIGANVALPMRQGAADYAVMGFGQLFRSEDPDVRAYAQNTIVQRDERSRETDFDTMTQAQRNRSDSLQHEDIWRSADPDLGDHTAVDTKCSSCKVALWTDGHPTFEVETGKYIARAHSKKCKQDGCASKAKTSWVPVDESYPFIHLSALSRKQKNKRQKTGTA